MAAIKTFHELLVWQKSHILVLEVYGVTRLFPRDELYILVPQIRRAAISIPANIVEGFRRKSLKDSLNFYRMADASLEELKYHLFLAKDLKYIDQINYNKLVGSCDEVGKLLTGWIQSQQKYL